MLAALAGAAALAQDAGPAAAEAAAAAAPTEAAAASSSALIATGFVLLGVGAVLAFLELFVPTAGVLAVATAVCLVASVVAFFMHSVTWGFAALVAYSAGAPFAVVFGFKLWSRTPIARIRSMLPARPAVIPSNAARARWSRPCEMSSPAKPPRIAGSGIGQRSPVRYGRNTSPALPIATRCARSARMS
jgi:hypothetical protein